MSLNALKKFSRLRDDAGIALITTLLLLFLMSSLLVGFTVLLMSNQQLAGSNNDDVTAFYGAEAGMEDMTAQLGSLFETTYSPTSGQIAAITQTPPIITLNNGETIQFMDSSGVSGYTITPAAVDANGNPAPTLATIKPPSPYAGMSALLTEYTMLVNARTPQGREAKIQRTIQTVGIPMFQFGIFSDTDLSFFPGPNFSFGGRTHTNGNLFLATGATLTMSDKVDAYKDVIRKTLENGWPTSSNYTGTVDITTQPGGSNYRALQPTEGSLTGGLGSSANSNWPTISTGPAPTDYNSNLINGSGSSSPSTSTGAKQLDLGIVTMGGSTTQEIDLIRRPVSGEAANVTGERYFAQASLRVLLSDNPSDIMNLPCIDGTTQPFDLTSMAQPVANWPISTYPPLVSLYNQMISNGVTPLPLAASGAVSGPGGAYSAQDGYWLPGQVGTQGVAGYSAPYPVIRGYIKIEEQNGYGSPCGGWKDVTIQVLAYGYVGRNINPVPQSLNGTSLNPQWPSVGATMQGQTCTSTTSCNQMDPLLGAYVKTTNAAGGYTVVGNQLVGPGGTGTTVLYGYPLPKVPLTTATPPVPVELAVQNPQPSSYLAAGNFTAIDALSAPKGTCMDPHPYAIIRLERIRDNPSSLYVGGFVTSGTLKTTTPKNLPSEATVAAVCGVDPSTGKLPVLGATQWVPTVFDFWPNTLFDTREGTIRDTAMNNGTNSTLPTPTLNGTMHYVELDANNLSSYFGGKLNTWTTNAYKDPAVASNNFVFYFSDRRGNYAVSQNIAGGWPPLSYTKDETGEYGWNDLVNNPATSSASGCPDNALEQGEDADGTSVLYTYGANEAYIHAAGATITAPATELPYGQIGIFKNLTASAIGNNVNCATAPSYVTDGIWPMMVANSSSAPRENPDLFFRRALKIVNGSNLSALGTCPGGYNCGLAVAAENPVYLTGDFNANYGGIGFGSSPTTVAASVAGDAVTLLSDDWSDVNSFSSPYNLSYRTGVTTWYRVAIVGGATPWFTNANDSAHNDFGTDGGVHNFLRYVEAWSGTLEYEGSIVDLFYSRQSNGTFKCCTTVYSPPTRGYSFDVNFLTPALLPPRTPLFRDVNTTGWTRLLLASQ